MCFFVGNDFLPHLPSLQIRYVHICMCLISGRSVRGTITLYPIGRPVRATITLYPREKDLYKLYHIIIVNREGAIDRLIRLYKEVVPQTHGYLTHNGEVNLPRVQLMLNRLGEVEDGIFKKRREDELEFRQRQKAKRRRMNNSYSAPRWVPQGQFSPQPIASTPSPVQNARREAYHMRQQSMNETDSAVNASNKSAAQDLRSLLKKNNSLVSTASPAGSESNETPRKRTQDQVEEEDEDANDDVR